MKRITLEEFLAEVRGQGVSRKHVAFKCPICSTVQSAASLIKARAGSDFDEVEKFVGFSCVGRFTHRGAFRPGNTPGQGCDWTLGGLFQLHKLEVLTEAGKAHPYFEVATSEEAHALLLINALPGECKRCGCTEENCKRCIERTGSPCHWTDETRTLCSACEEVPA